MDALFGVTPVLVEIWLKNGEKVSAIEYLSNRDGDEPINVCVNQIRDLDPIFDKRTVRVRFGPLVVRAEDISAIKYTPYPTGGK